ncbi:uncharacterized protein B0H64DRAFT_454053 [Chaetomium fimeti]|uniref:BPL/LPL catalytic domain-containing protein n=1 Tax=Chaetomium fimeti TaxID=1854472 RepID=A0AAE0HLW7_9PEZI|nr:hypothetical protein B0H64DRAFT_454053 [Chaetomium fimeti]
MAAPPRLRHLHLPSIHPHYVPYSLASRVQEHVRRQHLDFKDGSAASPPPPTLISFTPSPIYTLGRRQTTPLAAPEVARLTAPLQIPISPSQKNGGSKNASGVVSIRPQLLHSPRGGLTTYHGPGQVVLWPVLDLKSAHHRHFTVKCYARLLETTTIATLHRLFSLAAFTTEDPGVWVARSQFPLQQHPAQKHLDRIPYPAPPLPPSPLPEPEHRAKIAALGVHLRRHVTALGTAINVATPPSAVGDHNNDEATNPWARIVACGLAGRGVTSVTREVLSSVAAATGVGVEEVDERLAFSACSPAFLGWDGGEGGREGLVAGAWAGELAGGLGLGGGYGDGVEVVEAVEVVRLMEGLVGAAAGGGSGGGGGGEGREVVEEERGYLEGVKVGGADWR